MHKVHNAATFSLNYEVLAVNESMNQSINNQLCSAEAQKVSIALERHVNTEQIEKFQDGV